MSDERRNEAHPGSQTRRGEPAEQQDRDEVNEAAEESFPASDPPSWTPERAGAPTHDEEPPEGGQGGGRGRSSR